MPIQNDDDFWVTRLDRLEEKQDRILDTQTAMLLKVTHNTAVLEEHQRRSIANEKALETVRDWADGSIQKLQADLKVHNDALAARKYVAKGLGWLIAAGAGITGVLKVFLGL